ncbi:MAG: hypothetical protein PHU85_15340 [Phycisphaerae bacterium]|nr:hypothetical protein [Phycisphaerae bacterium]
MFAQTSRPASPPQLSLQQKATLYASFQKELAGLLEKKDFAAGADICRKMIDLAPQVNINHYNLACCLARLGKADEALAALAKAIDTGYTDTAHARVDDDLASLRENPKFKAMLDKIAKADADRADGLYEKGDDIEGVKTVEGKPESGLRWRLRMSPTATAEKPNRLIVWLHPSGGSMNKTVEPLAPALLKCNFALLVLTAKDWTGWNSADGEKLARTIEDAGKVAGIDAKKPILFGYSAGGQIALLLWYESPDKYGGLVLDAAYPVVPVGATGRVATLPPSAKPGVKGCPFFVLVGDQDGGARIWVAGEDSYRQAGVPLTIHYVTGQGHTWLFGGVQREKLYAWLGQVAAGKTPGVAATAPNMATTRPSGPQKPIKIDEVY